MVLCDWLTSRLTLVDIFAIEYMHDFDIVVVILQNLAISYI